MAKKPQVALAAISPLTATQVAKGLASAVRKVESASSTFLTECMSAASLIGTPITSKQFDVQLAKDIRAAFGEKRMLHLAETTRASYRSRLKTFCLAVNSGLEGMTPVAGETLPVFLARIAEPLALAKLADGRPVWETTEKAKRGRAAGTRSPKAGSASGGPTTGGGSAGSVKDEEGGLDVAPAMAAAMILAKRNVSRAQRMVVIFQTYAAEFDRWASSILTDADKAELAALTPPKADEPSKVAAPPAPQGASLPAVGAALVRAQAKVNGSKANGSKANGSKAQAA